MEKLGTPAKPEILTYIPYSEVAGALDWLARAFGFTEEMRMPAPNGGVHGEMPLDGQRIMLGQRPGGRPASENESVPAAQGIFVYLADVDAHFERARAAGARIDKSPQDLPYGRSYA